MHISIKSQTLGVEVGVLTIIREPRIPSKRLGEVSEYYLTMVRFSEPSGKLDIHYQPSEVQNNQRVHLHGTLSWTHTTVPLKHICDIPDLDVNI